MLNCAQECRKGSGKEEDGLQRQKEEALTGTLPAAGRLRRTALIIAALLMIPAGSFSAYAAGWTKDGSRMAYVSVSGDRASNVWKKGPDGRERWLDEYGYMVTDSWVKDDGKWYYVDEEGARLTKTFAVLPAPDEDRAGARKKKAAESRGPLAEDTAGAETFRYYFSSAGRRVENRWEEADGKRCYLGPDGKAMTGWILDNLYYTDKDGFALTGWQTIEGPDGTQRQYYFNTKGRRFSSEGKEKAFFREVDGTEYCFGPDGSTLEGWVDLGKEGTADWRYILPEGTPASGWLQIKKGRTEREYCFRENGSGVTGEVEGQLLYKGRVQKASGLAKYRAVRFPEDSPLKGIYLVDSGGMLVKDGDVTAGTGVRYITDRKGRVVSVDGKDPEKSIFTAPAEPETGG